MNVSFRKQILPYALVVFLGYLGFAMPLPVFPEMFLDSSRTILPHFSPHKRLFVLGWMFTAFPIGQVLGGPVLGYFSDLWGRKKVIMVTLLGSCLGYLLAAWGVKTAQLVLMYLGLLFAGFCEGNMSIAQSAIGDLTHESVPGEKAKQFGLLNFFACSAFIVGPFIGGYFADSNLSSYFGFATPFFFASFITALAAVYVFFAGRETNAHTEGAKEYSFFSSWKGLWQQKRLMRIYFAGFFLALALFSYWRFFPVYLERHFDFASSTIGTAIGYSAFIFAVGLALLNQKIIKHCSAEKAVALFTLPYALCYPLLVLFNYRYSWLYTLIPLEMLKAVVLTNAAVCVSNAATKQTQGRALGNMQSIQVTAELIVVLSGAFLATFASQLPIYLGGCMAMIAGFAYIRSYLKKN